MGLLSDRASKTSRVVLLPASLEDPSKSPPGLYRIGLLITCASILAFFTALVIAFYWRSRTPPFWAPITLPHTLWLSTVIILASSGTFEAARRAYRRGLHPAAARLLVATACLGAAFLASQLAAWRNLVHRGYYLAQNPYSSFFYMFTGLHAAHLIGGLVALFIVVLGRATRRETVDVVAYYWHFLGLLWIALFVILLIS
ncbi:MAG: cytochrome c oxidase subunit [Bryobacterales bacterium]|nr:cytochrome c oxidase subunit [Bryobacterales bacterium]